MPASNTNPSPALGRQPHFSPMMQQSNQVPLNMVQQSYSPSNRLMQQSFQVDENASASGDFMDNRFGAVGPIGAERPRKPHDQFSWGASKASGECQCQCNGGHLPLSALVL